MQKLFIYVFLLMSIISPVFIFSPVAQADSPPGVVDVFVTNLAYTYSNTYNDAAAFTPNIGAVKTVYVNGHVTDGDGVGTGFDSGNLESLILRFYRSTMGVSCDPDPNNCYYANCSVSANSQTVLNYSCEVNVAYLIDSTMPGGSYPNDIWNAEVIVQDDTDQIASQIKMFEIETLLAVTVPDEVPFGVLSPAQATTSQNNVEMVIAQAGNDVASLGVSGTDMVCSVNGTILVNKIEWSLSDVGAGNQLGFPLSTNQNDVEMSVGTDDDASLTDTLYWNVTLPTVISGECSGSITLNAVAA